MLSPTAFQTQPAPQGAPGENADKIDLYADLFAALFTVPPPVRWVDPLLAANGSGIDKKGGGATAESDTALPEFPLPPEAAGLPTKRSYITEADPLLNAPPIVCTIELGGPPLILPQDVKPGKNGTSAFESAERISKPTPITCAMPPDGKAGEGIAAFLPPDGNHIPVDILTLDGDDNPVEAGVDLLEIPSGLPGSGERPDMTVLDLGEREIPVVTISEPHINDPSIGFDRAPVRSSLEFSLREEFETHSDRESARVDNAPTLLETFTANVMVDTRFRETIRPAASSFNDPSDLVEAASLELEKPKGPDSDQATDFSFDSSVSSEASELRPPQIDAPEAKLREVVVEQVGSNVLDMLRDRFENGGKREITIRLKPEELGTVEITLVKNSEGIIDARFVTDNPQTQYLLDETLAQLRESLESSGIKVGSIETSCSTTFNDTRGGSNGSPESTPVYNNSVPLRETFDELPKRDEPRTDRLVNLRA